MTTENAHETEVDAILSKYGITYLVTYCGESVERENGREWKHDAWKATFGGKIVFSSDYKTGTGLRKMSKRGEMKPQFPKAGAVLYCLLTDGDALDQSFADWCDYYGYDEDSRKAESIYFQCCESGKNIRNCFSREAIQELRGALQDY